MADTMDPQTARSGPLSGCRVLVIEDEYFLADDIVRTLSALGASVVGPFGDLKEATDVVHGDVGIDAAIVDINLRSEMVFPLARILLARKVPFVFTTGYDNGSIAPEFQDVRLWGKPLDIAAMARDLTGMIKAT
jgi:CheY-like chemotaxis protein